MAAQGFFHRPQQVAAMADGNGQQAFGIEREGVEAGAIRRAAFGQRHVLGDPDEVFPGRSGFAHTVRAPG
ncbi:MAG: hypothetical protein GC182_10670 [Rhodopseudomonas sp.]|nr:hypothetical protein [Rhodopseudomonas sp.]